MIIRIMKMIRMENEEVGFWLDISDAGFYLLITRGQGPLKDN
jgi:hypothetical protein